jgi:peroxin-5
VELNPSFLDAWLALAISFSNEGRRAESYEALEKWVMNNQHYASVIQPLGKNASVEKKDHLIESLVAMIRSVPDGNVDADTQIALAVVLHTSEVSLYYFSLSFQH